MASCREEFSEEDSLLLATPGSVFGDDFANQGLFACRRREDDDIDEESSWSRNSADFATCGPGDESFDTGSDEATFCEYKKGR